MKHWVIRVTDANRVDQQVVVSVTEPTSVGSAARLALDQVLSDEATQIEFPVFLDIHAVEQFQDVDWTHRN